MSMLELELELERGNSKLLRMLCTTVLELLPEPLFRVTT